MLIWADRRFRLGHGKVFALYVVLYTAGRFWIEALRIDTVNEIGGFRLNNYTSLIVFLAALVWLIWLVTQPTRARDGRRGARSGTGCRPRGRVRAGGAEEPASNDEHDPTEQEAVRPDTR